MPTCLEFAIDKGGAVTDNIFDLKELFIRVVSPDDGEAQAPLPLE